MTITVYISIKGTKLGISVHKGRVVSTMFMIFLLLRKEYSITELMIAGTSLSQIKSAKFLISLISSKLLSYHQKHLLAKVCCHLSVSKICDSFFNHQFSELVQVMMNQVSDDIFCKYLNIYQYNLRILWVFLWGCHNLYSFFFFLFKLINGLELLGEWKSHLPS